MKPLVLILAAILLAGAHGSEDGELVSDENQPLTLTVDIVIKDSNFLNRLVFKL